MFVLVNTLIGIVLSLLVLIPYIGILFSVVSILFSLALIVPSLAVCVRRLHDVGKSGWMYFIVLIPLVGAIWLLVLFCTDSQPGINKWGPNPKETSAADQFDQL